jgi:hypothetical protein
MADWRPMAEFDPTKPALVHDRLNGKVIDWKPERYQRHYQAFATPFDPGVIEWDGLLLDGRSTMMVRRAKATPPSTTGRTSRANPLSEWRLKWSRANSR